MVQVYVDQANIINLISGEYIPSVNVGEEILSEAKKTEKPHVEPLPTYFKSYFTTDQLYAVDETRDPKLSLVSGTIDFYIINDLNLPEYCNCTPIKPEKQLQSIKVLIDKTNINEYAIDGDVYNISI